MRLFLACLIIVAIPFALILIGDAFHRLGKSQGSRLWTVVGNVLGRTGGLVVTLALAIILGSAMLATVVFAVFSA